MKRLSLVMLLTAALAVSPSAFGKVEKKEPKKPKEDVEAIGERDVGKGINFYSIEKEIALGKQLAAEVERNAKIVDDPVIAEYVNRVGQNLVRNSDARVPFTIKVIDSDEINAFALPGGYFYVNSGLVKLAGGEAELAGVMAHEIAHVAARHGTKQATKGQITNLATIPLIFLGGWTGYGIRQAAGLAVPLTFLKFSRNFEREADFLGVQYLYKTGYDPASMIQFFERLKAQKKKKTSKSKIAKVFKTHPLTEDRIKRIQKVIDELLPDRTEYAVNTSEFDTVKARLTQLQAGHRSRREELNPDRPTLKRKPPSGKIPTEDDGSPAGGEESEDERPTLKRRVARVSD